MNGVRLWLCICAVGLAGFALDERVLHAHSEGHHQHAHPHWHGHLFHAHHHSHGPSEGHEPRPDDSADARPCGGDEHHCCVECCPRGAVPFTLVPRETRRLGEFDSVVAEFDVSGGASFIPKVSAPPRAPPDGPTRQDTLPQLRTVVLLT